jgi:hypothetical protein
MESSNSLIYGLSILVAGIIGYTSMYVANNIFPITSKNISKPEPEPKVSTTFPKIESIPEEEEDFAGGGSETVEDSSDEEELIQSPEITTTANTWINPHSGGSFSFSNPLNNTTPIVYNQPLTNGLTYHF